MTNDVIPPMEQPGPGPGPAAEPLGARRRAARRWARRTWSVIRALILFLAVAWGALAIFYSNLPWAALRPPAAIAFFATGIWATWISRWPWARPAFALAFAIVLLWWISIRPSHDRPWRPEVAVMPRATVEGDRVRIAGFRNFVHQSRDEFVPRYEVREYDLSQLTALDFYISYWRPGPVAHTFVSFVFENAPPLCISIETRPEIGESFDPLGSMFKQFELIYIAGDERDIVGVRTHHRDEHVYLYRIRASPEGVRRLLLVYLERMNELADGAEWYHLLRSNCTLNIMRYANVAGRSGGFDIRHLINGYADRALYREGVIDTALPFADTRRLARINETALASDPASPDFSRDIRAHLPAVPHSQGPLRAPLDATPHPAPPGPPGPAR